MVDTQQLEKIGEGREAEMFAWGDGKILRLLRDPTRRVGVQWEAAAMQTARDRGLPVPAIYGIEEVMAEYERLSEKHGDGTMFVARL